MKIHLDTDFGGDPDDACALAMLLGWPGVEITGISTSLDRDGLRAAYVVHLLSLAGRTDIPVAAGAAASLTTLATAAPVSGDERHWPLAIEGRPSPPGAVLDLLAASLSAGAVLVLIGPYTNLAMLEVARPDTLARSTVVVMGGWVHPPAPGLPAWGPELDINVLFDTRAAEIVFASAGDLTLATLPAALGATLRSADLPRLRASGPIGASLAKQSEAHALDAGMAGLGRAHPGLPDDLVNVHWDPVACAVALGWPGAVVDRMSLSPESRDGVLRFVPDDRGRTVRVLTGVDGEAFGAMWIAAVEAAQQ